MCVVGEGIGKNVLTRTKYVFVIIIRVGKSFDLSICTSVHYGVGTCICENAGSEVGVACVWRGCCETWCGFRHDMMKFTCP